MSTPEIKFLDLAKVTAHYGAELEDAVRRVVTGGWYLNGPEVKDFERRYSEYIGTRHAIGTGNGLDALWLIFRALLESGRLQPGDEVIVPANTYIASILAITDNGLKPVLVEPDPLTMQLDAAAAERAVTKRTRAVLLVHLYGHCAYNEAVERLMTDHGLMLIEDNAQSHGCRWRGRRTGSIGLAAGHSFYPGKNLGALGDGGAVTTDDDELAATVRALGNYGSTKKYVFRYKGRNSRLDELQAAVLGVKLSHLDADNDHRRRIAHLYMDSITNPEITLPDWGEEEEGNVFHIFPIRTADREGLQRYLADNGIQTLIHYPIPPHKQECYKEWNGLSLPVTERIHATELSLPVSPVLTDEEASRVCSIINGYRSSRRGGYE